MPDRIFNLFSVGHGADAPGAGEAVDVLVNAPTASGGSTSSSSASTSTRIERIVSHGHASPPGFWYDQEEAEWVAVLSGEAVLEFEVSTTAVDSGDGDAPAPAAATTAASATNSCSDSSIRPVRMGPGDSLLIRPHERHRVAWTAPGVDTVWLAVFYNHR